MKLGRPTNAQLLASLERAIAGGYNAAAAERAKSFATRTSDIDFLQQLVQLLADAILAPKPKKRGAPRKPYPIPRNADGVYDTSDLPPMTARERDKAMKDYLVEMSTCMAVYEEVRRGVPIGTACQLHGIGTDTYYKHYPVDS